MNKQQTVSRRLLYGSVPAQFAQLNISDDLFEDEFEWCESENRFAGDPFTNYLPGFQYEIAAEYAN